MPLDVQGVEAGLSAVRLAPEISSDKNHAGIVSTAGLMAKRRARR